MAWATKEEPHGGDQLSQSRAGLVGKSRALGPLPALCTASGEPQSCSHLLLLECPSARPTRGSPHLSPCLNLSVQLAFPVEAGP